MILILKDVDESILKRVLMCTKCGSSHDYFAEFLKSSCHGTCNGGKLCDVLNAPKTVVCSTCGTSNATVGLHLKHIDNAELHKSDWFHCILPTCTQGGFSSIRYGIKRFHQYMKLAQNPC